MAHRAWTLLLLACGIAHAIIGITFLIGDESLPGPVFELARQVPDAGWGVWALASGLMVLAPRTRMAGLALTTAWYALWASVLIPGLVDVGGPYYAVPVYLLMLTAHALLAVIEWVGPNWAEG